MTVFALLMAGLGVVVAWSSATRLGFGTLAEPGAGFFPCAVGLVLAAAGAHSAASGWRGAGRGAGATALPRESLSRIGLMVASLVGWLLLLPAAGYVFATFLAVVAMSKTVGLPGRLRPVVLAAGVAAGLYLFFDFIFYVDLPRGLLAP